MIDSRFSNADTVPVTSVYGSQQMPVSYHHHRRRHHHKNKSQNDLAPLRRDESIHKVDHGHHHHFNHDEDVPVGSGFGVPYGAAGLPQQSEYPNQPQGPSVDENPVQTIKHHRRHRQNRHHTVEAANVGGSGYPYARGAPEQLIGQRSSSALSEREQTRSPAAPSEGEVSGGYGRRKHRRHHRHHHHHHHLGGESASFGQFNQAFHGASSVGADGYGHINEELIFIERGEQSPHRQEPPAGYEYKGRIEVQSVTRDNRSGSRGYEVPTYVPQPAPAPAPTCFPCPGGWQQAYLTPGGSGPCPSGGTQYTGQLVGASSSIGGYGSYGASGSTGGYGSYEASGSTGAYGSYGAPGSTAAYDSYGGASSTAGYGSYGGSYSGRPNCQYVDFSAGTNYQTQVEHKCPKIIEVWQKRSKTEVRSKSPGFDFDKFRREILAAIERLVPRGPAEIHWPHREEKKESEVRVIVQPIQPVFYMPRQSETPRPVGPTIVHQPSAPQVVYVPRNVYVPVVKPVFVPRERVIVRPQIVHVARPVLVDRPVPVTQRPIIIDRERPVPVPVRQERQQQAERIVKEEFVYRENVPKAYGARCAEFTGGAKFGYVPRPPVPCVGKIEVLDTTVNPNWQRTNESSLVQHYGHPAGAIVQKSKVVEQQMYSELHHSSSAGVIRSASSGTGFGVVHGGGGGGGGGYAY